MDDINAYPVALANLAKLANGSTTPEKQAIAIALTEVRYHGTRLHLAAIKHGFRTDTKPLVAIFNDCTDAVKQQDAMLAYRELLAELHAKSKPAIADGGGGAEKALTAGLIVDAATEKLLADLNMTPDDALLFKFLRNNDRRDSEKALTEAIKALTAVMGGGAVPQMPFAQSGNP